MCKCVSFLPAVKAQTIMVTPHANKDKNADQRLPIKLIPKIDKRSAGSSMDVAIIKDK